ncbi:serine/threonine-protein kinase [Streptomyces sp. TLI_105]|uniref:serine/threonine-protein kinase n=1 Tax=Streptomyces sp. TLI_105 TaxID=1881019 RepID=UPI000899B065|nr:Serine/threonine protein kinase [Streptomyces sp. TLI_105]
MDGVDLPERIGDYAVERELGAGGMGTVYLARSRGGRTVAVKVARPELAADPHFRARFRAEVDAARRVGGFHTAQVVDADPDAPAPWLATAYIAGPTLSGLLAERGPMDEARLRLLGAALAEALQAIHDCGLIHRDLKPGNIIMADDGPRVLDFGIARALESTRLTFTGAAFGTPGFLAPEQAQGLEVGGAADVFALGAVLVAAAGGHAFGEGTPMVLMYRAVHEPADLSALPEGVRPVVAACLAKDPTQRPTPKGLLDLLAPDTAPAQDTAVHPPTPPSPVVPPAPTPVDGPAAPSTAGAVAHAATVTGAPRAEPPLAVPQQPPLPPGTKTAPPGRKRTGPLAAGAAGALIVLGGAAYGVYASMGPGSDETFPQATHELVIPESIVGGAYGWNIENRLPPDPQPDSEGQRGSTHFSADYTVTSTGLDDGAAFRTVKVYGSSGRYKAPEEHRDALMRAVTVTGRESVTDPPRTIRVPGSDVDFRCETVDQQTVCGWGDDNTTVAITFTPTASLEVAAAETRKIRDDLRRPIAKQS